MRIIIYQYSYKWLYKNYAFDKKSKDLSLNNESIGILHLKISNNLAKSYQPRVDSINIIKN